MAEMENIAEETKCVEEQRTGSVSQEQCCMF